jgi:hypothetical protein
MNQPQAEAPVRTLQLRSNERRLLVLGFQFEAMFVFFEERP